MNTNNKDENNKRSNSHNTHYNHAKGQVNSMASDVGKSLTGKQSLLELGANLFTKTVAATVHTTLGVATELKNELLRPSTLHPSNSLKKQRTRKIIADTLIAQEKDKKLEEEKLARDSDYNPWWTPRVTNKHAVNKYGDEPVYQELVEPHPKCVYKGCAGTRTFAITRVQWDGIVRKFGIASAPANCNECKKLKEKTYQGGNITGNCEECYQPITYEPAEWDMIRKTVGYPRFVDKCCDCKRNRQLILLGERQLAKVFPATPKGLLFHDLEYALDGGKVFDKKETGLLDDLGGLEHILETLRNKFPPEPINDLISIEGLEKYYDETQLYHTITTDGGKNTIYEHVESHLLGVRVGDTTFNDNTLSSIFKSAKEAIIYAHYIASIGGDNGSKDRFVQITNRDGSISRFDLEPPLLLEINFKKPMIISVNGRPLVKRRIATIFQPTLKDKITKEKLLVSPRVALIQRLMDKARAVS